MNPLDLEEHLYLKEKHKAFNRKLRKVLQEKINFDIIEQDYGQSDLDMLFKIEIACYYEKVEYIFNILKSEDIFHISRILKRIDWLITDKKYDHLINPLSLYSQHFPHMTSKAISKFLYRIRIRLKDESRVEQFFRYYEERDVAIALKWLPNCSVETIERSIGKHAGKIKPKLFKVLCQKTPLALEKFEEYKELICPSVYRTPYIVAAINILKTNTELYLEAVEKLHKSFWPKFNKKQTIIITKKCPQKVLSKFKLYAENIDLKAFAKHLNKSRIEELILHFCYNQDGYDWFNCDNIKPIINLLKKEERFQFIKKVFIDKAPKDVANDTSFQWYIYSNFETTFKVLRELIKNESSPEKRVEILTVILKTTNNDMKNIHALLQYYIENHLREPLKFKLEFINSVIDITNTHKYNDDCWNILDEIFHSMGVYKIQENKTNIYKNCLEAITVYKVIHNYDIPETIEKRLGSSTLKTLKNKLKKEERHVIFCHLLMKHLKNLFKIHTNKDFDLNGVFLLILDIMDVIIDWDKDILIYPYVLHKIKELTIQSTKKGQIENLKKIYNKKKEWREYMFEESLLMSPSEDVYLNVLKRDPTLFKKYFQQVKKNVSSGEMKIDRFLNKVRVYWPKTLAKDWLDFFQDQINLGLKNKVYVRGVCILLPSERIWHLYTDNILDNSHCHSPDNILEKSPFHSPGKILEKSPYHSLFNIPDQSPSHNLIKNLATFMHICRPILPIQIVLYYTLSSHIWDALSSATLILFNISQYNSSQYIYHLLTAPVPLQKLAIRLVFSKFRLNEIMYLIVEVWNSTENAPIRAIIFAQSFKLLCIAKLGQIEDIWRLMETLLFKLSEKESSKTLTMLSKINNVPKTVQAKYFQLSYTYLKQSKNSESEYLLENLIEGSCNCMENIDSELIADILIEYINTKYVATKNLYRRYEMQLIIVAGTYVFSVTDDAEQDRRFNKVIQPWLNRTLNLWHVSCSGENVVQIYFVNFLTKLASLVRDNFIVKKYTSPCIVFKKIKEAFQSLPIGERYQTITVCNLMIGYIKSYDQIKADLDELRDDFDEELHKMSYHDMKAHLRLRLWKKISEPFANFTIELLKHDILKYFPHNLDIFSKILIKVYAVISDETECFDFERALIKDITYIPSYLLAIKILPRHSFYSAEEEIKFHEIRQIIEGHTSKEVQTHYYSKFYVKPKQSSNDFD